MDKNKRVKILIMIVLLAAVALAWHFLGSGGGEGPMAGIDIKGKSDSKDYRLDTEIFSNETYNNLQNLDNSGKNPLTPGNKNPFEEGAR